MDLKPFNQDRDGLINDFAKVVLVNKISNFFKIHIYLNCADFVLILQGGSTAFTEFKRIWLSKKFSFVFEASPSTNQACFMRSLYAHSIGILFKCFVPEYLHGYGFNQLDYSVAMELLLFRLQKSFVVIIAEKVQITLKFDLFRLLYELSLM